MTFVPRHYKKRNPLDRQVLGVRKPPPMPDCRCQHPWRQHHPRAHSDERGYCNGARCSCLGYRPVGSTGEDGTRDG